MPTHHVLSKLADFWISKAFGKKLKCIDRIYYYNCRNVFNYKAQQKDIFFLKGQRFLEHFETLNSKIIRGFIEGRMIPKSTPFINLFILIRSSSEELCALQNSNNLKTRALNAICIYLSMGTKSKDGQVANKAFYCLLGYWMHGIYSLSGIQMRPGQYTAQGNADWI